MLAGRKRQPAALTGNTDPRQVGTAVFAEAGRMYVPATECTTVGQEFCDQHRSMLTSRP